MLELYHNINSVCAQKVRIALEEKGQQAEERVLTLRGDQTEPAYLKLNPSGVVPTLVHDGAPIVESSLILYYIDEIFPAPPLMPKAPLARLRVRLYNKLIDEYVHNSCTIMTFATAFRPNFLKVPREVWLAEINKAPLKRRTEYKRSVIEHGLDSEFAGDALAQHRKLLAWMADSLARGPYLAGESFSNAECAVIPYILRLELLKLDRLWADNPAIADRWARMRAPVGQSNDLRPHDRKGLGAVQDSRARSVAQGAGAAASGVNRSHRAAPPSRCPLRLLRPAPLAKTAQAQARPSRSVLAEFPRQPKYEASHRQNRNFPE